MDSNVPQKLADAVAGNYDFSITAIVDEAWSRTKRFEFLGTFWGAALLALLCLFVFLVATYFLSVGVGTAMGDSIEAVTKMRSGHILVKAYHSPIITTMLVLWILALPFLLSLMAGIWMIGIHHAADLPTRFTMVFNYFNSKLQLLLGYSWIWLLLMIAEVFITQLPEMVDIHKSNMSFAVGVFSLIFGVVLYMYALVSYLFYNPLIVEKKLTAWQALETSRQATSHRMLKIARLIVLIMSVLFVPIFVIAALVYYYTLFFVLGVIYVWLIPFMFLTVCILYREIFGVAKAS